MKIELTEAEYNELYQISKERQEINSKNKIQNQKKTPNRDDFEIYFIGSRAEYGFCKLFNLVYDKSTYSRKGDKDCIYKGFRIDVKGSDSLRDNVYVKYRDYPYVDVFAFCHVNGRFVNAIGYQFKDFVTNPNHLIQGHNGPCYKIPIRNLHKFKTYANP